MSCEIGATRAMVPEQGDNPKLGILMEPQWQVCASVLGIQETSSGPRR